MLQLILIVLLNVILGLCYEKDPIWLADYKELFPLRNISSLLDIIQKPKYKRVPGVAELIDAFYNECHGDQLRQPIPVNETHRHPFVVIIGFGGSEKELIIREVRKRLGWVYLPNPPACISNMRLLFEKHTSALRHAFGAISFFANSILIRKYVQTYGVITDWYWYSWIAKYIAQERHANIFADRLPPNGSDAYNYPVDLLEPDLTMYLYVSNETYRRWILHRSRTDILASRPLDEIFRRLPVPKLSYIRTGYEVDVVVGDVMKELQARKILSNEELAKINFNEAGVWK